MQTSAQMMPDPEVRDNKFWNDFINIERKRYGMAFDTWAALALVRAMLNDNDYGRKRRTYCHIESFFT